MKRFLVSLAFAAGMAPPAVAVAQDAPPIRLGLLGGVNFATLKGDDDEGLKTRTGLLAGATMVKPFRSGIGLEIDALYSMKGAKAEEDGGSLVTKVDYIEVPVMLRYDLSKTGNAAPHFGAGLSLAYQTRCRVEATGGGMSASVNCSALEAEQDITFKTFDVGIVAGAGVDFTSGSTTYTMSARYTVGLTDLTDQANLRNRAFQFFAGVAIPINR
ncbi:MAG: porin family protein [Gemmatimonadota bacterium]|nr:porin family protein [Gemmatimonadota bacterium]